MPDIFIVIKTGVHRHEIIGAFSTLERAQAAAYEAGDDEPDNYHSFEVTVTRLDQRVEDVKQLGIFHPVNNRKA